MKKHFGEKVISEIVKEVTSRNVNSACCFWVYQPLIPKKLESLKKQK